MNSAVAASTPTFLGRPAQPDGASWMTRMWGCLAARASSVAPEPSVEPSSTNTASSSPGGIVCARTDSMHWARYDPAL